MSFRYLEMTGEVYLESRTRLDRFAEWFWNPIWNAAWNTAWMTGAVLWLFVRMGLMMTFTVVNALILYFILRLLGLVS